MSQYTSVYIVRSTVCYQTVACGALELDCVYREMFKIFDNISTVIVLQQWGQVVIFGICSTSVLVVLSFNPSVICGWETIVINICLLNRAHWATTALCLVFVCLFNLRYNVLFPVYLEETLLSSAQLIKTLLKYGQCNI